MTADELPCFSSYEDAMEYLDERAARACQPTGLQLDARMVDERIKQVDEAARLLALAIQRYRVRMAAIHAAREVAE